MGKAYSPVKAIGGEWRIGMIDNHAARPLTFDEIDEVCDAMNERAAPPPAADAVSEAMVEAAVNAYVHTPGGIEDAMRQAIAAALAARGAK